MIAALHVVPRATMPPPAAVQGETVGLPFVTVLPITLRLVLLLRLPATGNE